MQISVPPTPERVYRPDYKGLLHLSYLDTPIREILYIGHEGIALQSPQTPLSGPQVNSLAAAQRVLIKRADADNLPEAIVCDANMADGDVGAWIALLRQDTVFATIPLVLVGAPEDWPDREEAIQQGIDDCLSPHATQQTFIHRLSFLREYRQPLLDSMDEPPATPPLHLPFTKRATDVTISLLLLGMLAPLCFFAWVILRLQRKGPVFVRKKLVGTGYKVFNAWSFRITALPILKEGWFQAIPHLIGVLRGDLSLVGNRPLELAEAARLTQDATAARLCAPTGLTGPWRLHTGYRIEASHSTYPIHQAHIGKDLMILAHTALHILKGR